MMGPFTASIARIRGADEIVVGTGFLVDERLVLTCAHVVAQALEDLSDDTATVPQTAVHLDFPLVAPGQVLIARVVHWQPTQPDGRGDIAGLELLEDRPAGTQPVQLMPAEEPWGHSFRAFGFPEGYENGVWASGRLLEREATGWLQVEDVKQTGYFVAPGFSGGPVWNEDLVGVVGMIVAAEARSEVKAAFCIPTETLVAAWPVLAQVYLDAQMERLRAQRDQADRERRTQREGRRVVNLRPLDMTHTFKDRLREMRELCQYLADSRVRLVSVVGRSGMGKTALVCRVLADLEGGQLPVLGVECDVAIDGILYLSARSTGLGLERIYADVGRLLGEPAAEQLGECWADPDTPQTAKVEFLLEMLQDGRYVILLDNLEDVLNEAGDIAEEGLRLFTERCLMQSGGVQLVITSREEVRLPAAALPSARYLPLRKGLPEDDAVALLRDLDPQSMLGLQRASEADLRRAVQVAQGIPRALELVAGILHEDSTVRLSDLLAGAGEQVVEQLVAEGYHRLGENRRRVLEALAVFDRPVDVTALAYLLHPWHPGLDVRAALRRLIRSHFVIVSAARDHSLHPLDREYVYRQLLDEGEPEAYTWRNLELRAADFYARICKPEGEWNTIDDLAPQLAEFEHRVRAGDYDRACRVLNQIDYDNLFLWGHYARIIQLRERLLGRLTDPDLVAYNLGSLGLAYYSMGQAEEAIQFYEQARTVAHQLESRWSESLWLANMGNAYRVLGWAERAVALCEQASSLVCETQDHRLEGIGLGGLGNAYRDLGQINRAIKCYEQALIIARQRGNRRGEGRQLGRLGIAYYALGQTDRAVKLYREALGIAREIGDRRSENAWLHRLGTTFYVQGQLEEALEFYQQALDIARKIMDSRGQSHSLLGLSRVLVDTRQYLEALHCCTEALDLNVLESSYRAALVLGIVSLYRQESNVKVAFADAMARCRTLLGRTAGLYEARYALAAAQVGAAICDTNWTDEGDRASLLAPAMVEYRRALETCAAPGVVQDAIHDLELIQAAGIEGLEPMFELLEAAL